MPTNVKIPESVYERVSDEAEKADISRGAVLREWMIKADAYDSVLFKSKRKNDLDE